MIVMKFGGSSVESASAIERVASIVRSHIDLRPVVVVSAMAKTTDSLLRAVTAASQGYSHVALREFDEIRGFHLREAQLLLRSRARRFVDEKLAPMFRGLEVLLSALAGGEREFTPRTQDEALSYGERLSCEIVAAAFQLFDIPAASLDARKVILTGNQFTRAVPLYAETYALLRRTIPFYPEDSVVVMGGFIGSTEDGITTTLGRGGSDLTASIVGAGIAAEEIQIWTDVDGMLTCDPRVFDGGHRVLTISYAEASEMARLGAKVLHPATMIPAVRQRIPIVIRNSRKSTNEGTRIVASPPSGEPVVKSITSKRGMSVVHIEVRNLSELASITDGLWDLFQRENIVLDLVQVQKSGISLAVENSEKLPVLLRKVDSAVRIRVEEDSAMIGLVGNEIGCKIMDRARASLNGFPVRMQAVGKPPYSLGFLVPEGDLERCVESLHGEFFSSIKPELFASLRPTENAVTDRYSNRPVLSQAFSR